MSANSNYLLLDRLLHELAFGSTILQELLDDIESNLYSSQWKKNKIVKPIFITSLPRAGTTIILESLFRLPSLVTHTYRDMPFVLTPILWNKISSVMRRKGTFRERAHSDGLMISEDSPEAFEEVLWRKYFPLNYSASHILLWDSLDEDFKSYFQKHILKILFLRGSSGTCGRYISKNNANIARIGVIKEMFPDAYIIIPFRSPLEHAVSLWQQHKNFLEQHNNDSFVFKYMEDIGHFEFGDLHKPIQFAHANHDYEKRSPLSLNYWLEYWVFAFEYLIKKKNVKFISYEHLCDSPEYGLNKICNYIHLDSDTEAIRNAAGIFRASPKARAHKYTFDNNLVVRAKKIHEQLLISCLLNS